MLSASEAQAGENFGSSVDIRRGKVVVGAPGWDDPTNNSNARFDYLAGQNRQVTLEKGNIVLQISVISNP